MADDSDPGLQRIRDLIEASSLGTPAAKRLRERTGDDVIEDVQRRMYGRRPDLITGTIYLERGEPVRVITRWGPGGGPRNVLVERADGSRVVRPFRGLRRPR
jgi:acetyl esterase